MNRIKWIIVAFLAANQLLIGSLAPKASGSFNLELKTEIIPAGIPEAYGAILDISYDDVRPDNPALANRTIEKMSQMDRTLELEGEDLERYINILYRKHGGISCEYCCGARSVIFENGEAACGCAHSYAMRGLAKYLILEQKNMSDDEIFAEIGKWKVLFFPDIHIQKAAAMEQKGLNVDYVSLTSNAYRGIESE